MKARIGAHFIASYPKSGNTWVRCFLEYLYLGRIDINRLALVQAEERPDLYAQITSRSMEEITQTEVAMLRPAMLHNLCMTYNFWLGPHIIKTHWRYTKNTRTLNIGSIYLVRDPRDVVVSQAKHTDMGIDSTIKAINDPLARLNKLRIITELGSWSDHVMGWKDHATVIRYEDLPSDFKKIAKALPKAPYPVKDASDFCSIERLRKQEDMFGFEERKSQNNKFFGPAKAGGWKDVLSQSQVDAIVAPNKEVMQTYGYI